MISDYQKKIYRNLIKYSVQLMRDIGNTSKVKEIYDEILEVKQIADFRWLEEKMTEYLR
ncbi:MAG: hypothetical protein IPP51_11005 [Bacteroidetes bacterium]|nr:hypothetical protein [Bacteroidota bacterium]